MDGLEADYYNRHIERGLYELDPGLPGGAEDMKYHIGERTVQVDESAESRYKAALEEIGRLALDDYINPIEITDIVHTALIPKWVQTCPLRRHVPKTCP